MLTQQACGSCRKIDNVRGCHLIASHSGSSRSNLHRRVVLPSLTKHRNCDPGKPHSLLRNISNCAGENSAIPLLSPSSRRCLRKSIPFDLPRGLAILGVSTRCAVINRAVSASEDGMKPHNLGRFAIRRNVTISNQMVRYGQSVLNALKFSRSRRPLTRQSIAVIAPLILARHLHGYGLD